MWCATTSCSSRAIAARSAATASRVATSRSRTIRRRRLNVMRPSRNGTPNVTIRSVRISIQLRPRSHRSPTLIATEVSDRHREQDADQPVALAVRGRRVHRDPQQGDELGPVPEQRPGRDGRGHDRRDGERRPAAPGERASRRRPPARTRAPPAARPAAAPGARTPARPTRPRRARAARPRSAGRPAGDDPTTRRPRSEPYRAPLEASSSCRRTQAGRSGGRACLLDAYPGPGPRVCSMVNRWIASVSSRICFDRSSSCSFCVSSSWTDCHSCDAIT